MMKRAITCGLLLLVCGSVAAEPIKKSAKTTAVHPSAPRKQVKTALKGPPANELFGGVAAPAPLAARAIGSYAKGCLGGTLSLPINGPAWQVMRLSRDRNWGHPRLLDFLERFAADARTLDGWPGLLVGDMSQPRGGPMITGHTSHQVGLDVDLWLTPMPDRTLTAEERENMIAVSMLKDPLTVDRSDQWTHSPRADQAGILHIRKLFACSCTSHSSRCCEKSHGGDGRGGQGATLVEPLLSLPCPDQLPAGGGRL